jgi:hypothetical protein
MADKRGDDIKTKDERKILKRSATSEGVSRCPECSAPAGTPHHPKCSRA